MITPKKIFNIQKRVISVILGISIFLSPCITYKICEYLYYIKHKGECSYNMYGLVVDYFQSIEVDCFQKFYIFLGFVENFLILVGIGIILLVLLVKLAMWLITDGGKEKKKKNEDE